MGIGTGIRHLKIECKVLGVLVAAVLIGVYVTQAIK
jgi:hypothetical protein